MALVSCTECGKEISDKAAACPYCGVPLGNSVVPARVILSVPKNRGTAVVLALLLGGLGMHKFYLNKVGTGVLYILFCWTFIPAIFGFIEGLNYLFMTDKTFQERYVTPAE